MRAIFESYLSEINTAYLNGDATEHTHRPALKTLIEAMAVKITCTNEPKRLIYCGAPDMKISRRVGHSEQAFGYVECKDIGVDLKKEEKGEQLKRYRAALDTLILTDYVNFRLYKNGQLEATATLAKEGKGGKFVGTDESIKETQGLFAMFLAAEPVYVKNAKELAERMAGMAKLLKATVEATFKSETERGSLHEQYDAFKDVLIHELTEEQFADMYTQTLVYGLFCARCFLNEQTIWGKDADAVFAGIDDASREFSRQTAARLLPKTNPFLKKIFGHLELELDDRIGWLVDDVVALLKNAQMGQVIKYFGQESTKKDPVIHFYETFLTAYDPKLRESRGVYYTPEPVVSYIVRSVDGLLKEKFGLKKGLADNKKIKLDSRLRGNDKKGEHAGSPLHEMHRCLILDPAVGTGTFLYEVIKTIHAGFADKGSWPSYVEEHLLPRMFGFELMMAPYTVCHMKLGLLLRMLGYRYEHDKRLEVYLTNTLEEAEEVTKSFWSNVISEEARQANRVKRDLPIMVVLGNPPYSGHSSNTGDWIKGLVKDYYFVDGKPLGEKNSKWLQDDYVKFIRYGQYRIEQTGSGVLAFITNHGYLDNPTFRGMRQQLMKTFSEIYILDLHGNTKKKEVCPDGSPDKNVFDIQQGVSIGIFIKTPSIVSGEHAGSPLRKNCGRDARAPICRQDAGDTLAEVYHAELWGDRKDKYEWLNEYSIEKTKWTTVKPELPFYLFNPQDKKLAKEYQSFWKITDVLQTNVLGFQTHRDDFAIDYDSETLKNRIKEFIENNMADHELADKNKLTQNKGWILSEVRKNLRKQNDWTKPIIKCLYRPFDERLCYFDSTIMDRPRRELLDHVAWRGNLCLLSSRQQGTLGFRHVLLSRYPANDCVVSNISREANQVFPLYLYSEDKTQKGRQQTFGNTDGDWPVGKDGRVPNLDKGFVEAIAERVGLGFVSDGRGDFLENEKSGRDARVPSFGPEDVFAWIYGVFHSPPYRARYAEFLKIDFPRVPLPKDRQQFVEVCTVGHQLVAVHLMESSLLEDGDRQPRFVVVGDNTVEAGYPKYDGGKVSINPKQYFDGVREDVWAFMIGGYQVCEKWLKDRRGRTLGYDDIEHYKKICVALGETIGLMADERLFIDY